MRAGLQQGEHRPPRRDDVLEVVQQQQQALPAQRGRQSLVQRRGVALIQAQALRDGGEHQGGVAQRRQVDEDRAIAEVVRRALGHRDRQARLADPAGPRQGEQPGALRFADPRRPGERSQDHRRHAVRS